uniref:Conserved plasma membrane protein n=1 Tax=Syphacia muris TaxID=451379 RepID=A0A0N5AR88_9BILA
MQYTHIDPYVFLSLFIALPAFSGFYHFFCTPLFSPIHFQQVLLLFNLRTTATVLFQNLKHISLFSASFYIFYSSGYVISVLLSAFTVSSVLHYIPSPSICHYYHRRFHCHYLTFIVVSINAAVQLLLAICFLTFSTLIANIISHYSIIILCALLGYLAIFSIISAGQAFISSTTCIISFLVCYSNILLLKLS